MRAGAAGSDTRRPATDAIDCSGVRTIVLPRAVTVIARASVSSRTAHLEGGRELVERDHLDVVHDTVGSGRDAGARQQPQRRGRRVLPRETGTDDEQDDATEDGGSQAADHNRPII